ncbi:MAG: bifunctional oligoribonuclease/PAP phosphatase NrnA [bacterium]|nr:bifunctional oligoribonuclease/PAP phosphatase NrnA [bacterium]
MTPIPPAQFQQAATAVQSWRRPLVLTHTRPDGDALGAVLAMRSILRSLGSSPLVVLFDPAPAAFGFMVEPDPLAVFGRDVHADDLASVDGVLILDTCAFAQLTPLAEWLRSASVPVIAVDHHVTRDVPGDMHLIDSTAAAATLVVYDWARAQGWLLDAAALTALFVGLAMDTGWFAFSNTDPRALEAAASLVRQGVDAHDLYVRVYQGDSAAKVRMLGAALETLELHQDGRIAIMQLDRPAFERCGAEPGDTEGIVNEPLRISSVDVSLLLVEGVDGPVRVSFRSKRHADVATLAAEFGGGGHRSAAGARIAGALAEVKNRVLARTLST